MRTLGIVACVVIVFGAAGVTKACSCVPVHPLDLFASLEVVFSGVVEKAVLHPRDPALGWLSGNTEYTFHTVQVWKGPLFKTFQVVAGGGCGYSFELGKHYIVYAHVVPADAVGREDVLTTNQCERPQLMEEALWDRTVTTGSLQQTKHRLSRRLLAQAPRQARLRC
jgi:hypothetical protein